MLEEGIQTRCAESTPPRDSHLAARIRAGDRAAFKELFLEYYEALCRYAYRYVGAQDVAEDLVQDVFFDLWNRRETWHPKHSLRAFLYGAVRNQTLNYQRRTRAHARGDDAIGGLLSLEDPEETFRYGELSRVAEQAIRELPPRCRHMFMLSREHELTYAEIAAATGVSIKTVETQMGRALQHLRDRLSSLRA